MRLLQAVWGQGHRLDLLAAWLWSAPFDVTAEMRFALGLEEGAPSRIDPGAEWWAALNQRVEIPDDDAFVSPGPYSSWGGSDMLHLSMHFGMEEKRATAKLFVGSEADRRAVLIVEPLTGWYLQLARLGSELPDIENHSWHVDVVCPQAGWLGKYRRSRRTGLWFAGKHSIHELGNRKV